VSVKRFCDVCGDELLMGRNLVTDRLKETTFIRGTKVQVEVVAGIGGTWNSGDLCLFCLFDVLGRFDRRQVKVDFPRDVGAPDRRGLAALVFAPARSSARRSTDRERTLAVRTILCTGSRGYQWGEYVVPTGVEQRTVEMYDSEGGPDKEQVDELAEWVIGQMREGKRVLVHCQAGLNRSSMIAARVLMLFKHWTADEAIAHIRQRRSPMCLCNETFEDFLRSLA